MIYSVTYDVICLVCKKIAWHGEIGEYPWSWQFSVCPSCGGSAVPDLKHPTEHHLTQRTLDGEQHAAPVTQTVGRLRDRG